MPRQRGEGGREVGRSLVLQSLKFVLELEDRASAGVEKLGTVTDVASEKMDEMAKSFLKGESVTKDVRRELKELVKEFRYNVVMMEKTAGAWRTAVAALGDLTGVEEPLKRVTDYVRKMPITKEMEKGAKAWVALMEEGFQTAREAARFGGREGVREFRQFMELAIEDAKKYFGDVAMSRLFWKRLADRRIIERDFYRAVVRNLDTSTEYLRYCKKFWAGIARWSKEFWRSTFGQVLGAMALMRILERMFAPLIDTLEYLMESALWPLISEINRFLIELVPLVRKTVAPIADVLSAIVNALTGAGKQTSGAMSVIASSFWTTAEVMRVFCKVVGTVLEWLVKVPPVAWVLGAAIGVVLVGAVASATYHTFRYILVSNQVMKTVWGVIRAVWREIVAWVKLIWTKKADIAATKAGIFWTKAATAAHEASRRALVALDWVYRGLAYGVEGFCRTVVWLGKEIAVLVKSIWAWVVANIKLAWSKIAVARASLVESVAVGKAAVAHSVGLAAAKAALWGGRALVAMWGALVVAGKGLALGLLFLGKAMWVATLATLKFTMVLLANPITWVVLGIVAAVALLAVAVWKFWKPIKVAFGWLWGLVKGLWNLVVGTAQKVWSFVKKWGPLIAMVALGPMGLIAGAAVMVVQHWEKVKGAVVRVVGWVKGAVSWVIGGVWRVMRGAWGVVKSVVSGVASWVWGGLKSMASGIWGLGKKALFGIGSLVKGAWSTVVGGAWNLVKGVGSRLVGWFGLVGKGWTAFKEKAAGVLKSVAGYLGINLEGVKKFGKAAIQFLLDPFGSLRKVASGAFNLIWGGFNKLFGWFKALKLPRWVMRLLGLDTTEVVKTETQKVGEAMATGVAEGQKRAAPQVAKATEQMVGESAKYLPSSNAQAGPLSRLSEMGESLVKTFAEGMKSQRMSLLGVMNKVLGFVFRGLRPPSKIMAMGVQNLVVKEVKVPLEGMSPEKITVPIVNALEEQVRKLMVFIEEMVQLRRDLDLSDLDRLARFELP